LSSSAVTLNYYVQVLTSSDKLEFAAPPTWVYGEWWFPPTFFNVDDPYFKHLKPYLLVQVSHDNSVSIQVKSYAPPETRQSITVSLVIDAVCEEVKNRFSFQTRALPNTTSPVLAYSSGDYLQLSKHQVFKYDFILRVEIMSNDPTFQD